MQLSQSEQSREQLQQSLQAIDRSQPQLSLQLSSLQDSLRHAQQEITRLENISHETVCLSYRSVSKNEVSCYSL